MHICTLFLAINFPNWNSKNLSSAKDEEAGEIPVAFVVPKDGTSLSQPALLDYVAKQVYFSLMFPNY